MWQVAYPKQKIHHKPVAHIGVADEKSRYGSDRNEERSDN
jgi:hypothetical protein